MRQPCCAQRIHACRNAAHSSDSGSDSCGLLLLLVVVMLLLLAEAGRSCLQRHELLLLLDGRVYG
jgi:hypothetical protein